MCNSFYKVHGEVLKFDIDKDIDLLRFNQWIMRKENVSRIDESNERGTFEMTVRTVEKDLGVTFHRARAMIKKFEDLGIIMLIRKSRNKSEGSLYAYTTNYENSHTVSRTVSRTDKVSDCNGLEGVNNTTNHTVNRTSKKENKKENKKDIDLISAYTQNIDLVEAIKDFIKMRKTIKKPLTDRALKGILNKLDSFSNSDEEKIMILEASIENCWQGVFELKNKKAPIGVGTESNKKYNYDNSICKKEMKNTPTVKEYKFI